MKTVGEILQAARREKDISIEELARKTKIQERFLLALESMDTKRLPAAPFVRGFIRTAAAELDLEPDGMIAIFRRDFGVDQLGQVMSRTIVADEGRRFSWTPRQTVIAAVAFVILVFGAYLAFQLKLLVSAPSLVLTDPGDQAVVGENVLVEGRTDPAATIAINGQEIKKNRNGVFSQVIQLPEGMQKVTITAIGQNGKTTYEERTVQVKKSSR